MIIHLMTQRNQPYGSERRCCEKCGVMLVGRDEAFWKENTWTDKEEEYKAQNVRNQELLPCS